jgi:hypothetical protein
MAPKPRRVRQKRLETRSALVPLKVNPRYSLQPGLNRRINRE